MHPGISAGITASRIKQGGGSTPLALSGTAEEGQTLTATGGTGTYTWKRFSDDAVLGTGPTYVIPWSDYRQKIYLDDGVSTTTETAEVTQTTFAVMYIAGDWGGTGTVMPNSGTWGSALDLNVSGVDPTQGTDAFGPYIDTTVGNSSFTLANAAYTTNETSEDWTLVNLSQFTSGDSSVFKIDEDGGDSFHLINELGRTHRLTQLDDILGGQTVDFANGIPDADDLSIIVMDSTRELCWRYSYRDRLQPADSGLPYRPLSFPTIDDIGWCSNDAGSAETPAKHRFVGLAPEAMTAAKRAEIRQGLINLGFTQLDANLEDLGTLIMDLDADDLANLTKNGSNEVSAMTDKSAQANAFVDAGTSPLIWHAGTPELFNGKAYLQSQSASDSYLNCAAFDTNGNVTDHSLVVIAKDDESINAGRWFGSGGITGNYPQLRTTGAQLLWYPYAGTGGASLGVDNNHQNAPQTFVTTSTPTNSTIDGSFGDASGDVAPATTNGTTITDDSSLTVFGAGNAPDAKFARMLWYKTELTPTERLLALAAGYEIYGTGRDAVFDLDVRDATVVTSEITEIVDRVQGEVFAPDSGGTGPDIVADHFGTGMDAAFFSSSLESLVVESADTSRHISATSYTFFAVVNPNQAGNDSRVFQVGTNLIINDGRGTNPWYQAHWDGVWRDSTVAASAGKQIMAWRVSDSVTDFFVDGVHIDQVANGTGREWAGDTGGLAFGCSTAPSLARQHEGYIGKVVAYVGALDDERVAEIMTALAAEWDVT